MAVCWLAVQNINPSADCIILTPPGVHPPHVFYSIICTLYFLNVILSYTKPSTRIRDLCCTYLSECKSGNTKMISCKFLLPVIPCLTCQRANIFIVPKNMWIKLYLLHVCFVVFWCHRIIEWPGLKRTTMIINFQPPCYVQGHQPPDQTAQSHIQPGLECLQGCGIHSLLGQPVPACHHPLCVKLPPKEIPRCPNASLWKASS